MPTPWNENGMKGCRRFLDKIWRMLPKVSAQKIPSKNLETLIHKTIKGVSEDYENLKFNTAIAKMMTLANEFGQQEAISREEYEVLLKLLSPVASHVTEELWHLLGNTSFLVEEKWPEYDPLKLLQDKIEIVINVNGKIRDKVMVPVDMDEAELIKLALAQPKIQEWIKNQTIKKTIVVKNKLVNIVI
jgi:leucyl-tRNA synthetase